MTKLKKLLIIMPCYNEEEILKLTIKTMNSLMRRWIKSKKISADSRVCFVNDGSTDKTWDIISQTVETNKLFCGINLSRNFGQQEALLAGLYNFSSDIYVTMDVDLQDDPECIPEMLEKIENGCDIVYGVRQSRESDTWFKKWSALACYKFLGFLGVKMVYNCAHFRMMTDRAVKGLKQFPERNLFLRGIVPLIGFNSDIVYYDRGPRAAGQTKYSLGKLVALAWDGISNFSIVPLRMVTFLGFILCFMAVLFLCFVIYRWSIKGTIVGWASLVTIITVFSGVQLVSLGIIGEYLAKVFVEVKKRPLFIVQDKIGQNEQISLGDDKYGKKE